MCVALVTDRLEDGVNVRDAGGRGNVIDYKYNFLYVTAVCSSDCYNGGTCVSPNTCSCALGWTGRTCQTGKCVIHFFFVLAYVSCLAAVCTSGCYNGGTCVSPNTCSCASGWMGRACQTRECMSGYI